MGLFGDQGRLARMWEPVHHHVARKQMKSPPPSAAPPTVPPPTTAPPLPPPLPSTADAPSIKQRWYTPRKFSEKIALQKKRQQVLEETLKEVHPTPVTPQEIIMDPSLARHPAAQYNVEYEMQVKRMEELAISQQQRYRYPALAPAPSSTSQPGFVTNPLYSYSAPAQPSSRKLPQQAPQLKAPSSMPMHFTLPPAYIHAPAPNHAPSTTNSHTRPTSAMSYLPMQSEPLHMDRQMGSAMTSMGGNTPVYNNVIMTPCMKTPSLDSDDSGALRASPSTCSIAQHPGATTSNAPGMGGSNHFNIESLLAPERPSLQHDTASVSSSVHSSQVAPNAQPYTLMGRERGGSVRLQRSMSRGEIDCASSLSGRRAMSLKAPHRHRGGSHMHVRSDIGYMAECHTPRTMAVGRVLGFDHAVMQGQPIAMEQY